MGLALWSLWGSKHDKMTMDREAEADKTDKAAEMRPTTSTEGEGARSFADIERQGTAPPMSPPTSPGGRNRSRRRMVSYEGQTDDTEPVDEITPAAELAAWRNGTASPQFLSPEYPGSKRPYVNGIAVPFSLKKEAETASMMTLTSNISGGPLSPAFPVSSNPSQVDSLTAMEKVGRDSAEGQQRNSGLRTNDDNEDESKNAARPESAATQEAEERLETPLETSAAERPGLETFSTAAENLPTTNAAKVE